MSTARVVVRAGAGTGKTTTLRLTAEHGLRGRRALYLAFNRELARDAAEHFPDYVRCKTPHAVAYGAIGHRFASRLPLRIPSRHVADRLGMATAPLELSSEKSLPRSVAVRLARDTVANFCHSAGTSLEPDMVPQLAGTTADVRDALVSAVLPLAHRLWHEAIDTDSALPITHDHYFKLWQLSEPRLAVDTVLLDEAQDTNPALMAVLDGQAEETQRIYVGDDAQQIYGWRGAHDAMRQLANVPGAQVLHLSQSWRFGQHIATYANQLLTCLGSPLRLTGHPNRDSTVGPSASAGTRLCRTNGQVISDLMTALAEGRDVAVVGGTGQLEQLARAAGDLQSGRRASHHSFALFNDWDELREYSYSRDGGDLRSLVEAIDDHSVEVIQQAIARVGGRAPARADLVLSTTHRAKGGEWDAVALAGDFPAPEREAGLSATGEDQANTAFIDPFPDSELMLLYVACTRARHHLDPGEVDRWIGSYLEHRGHRTPEVPRRERPVASEPVLTTGFPKAEPPRIPARHLAPPAIPAVSATAIVRDAVDDLVRELPGLLARLGIADCLTGRETGKRRGLPAARQTVHWARLADDDDAYVRTAVSEVLAEGLADGTWTTTEWFTIAPAGWSGPDPVGLPTPSSGPRTDRRPDPAEMEELLRRLEGAVAAAAARGISPPSDFVERLMMLALRIRH